MYAVGGLIGGCSQSITMYFNDNEMIEETASEAIVLGLADVGGIMGKAQNFTIIVYENVELKFGFEEIAGIVNVGGIVGYASEINVDNMKISCEGAVKGNLNVGGLVGYATKGTLKNISADISEKIYNQ